MLLHRRYINNLSKKEEPEIDYSIQYFTIESLEDNNRVSINFGYQMIDDINPFTCYYSTDNGVTWNAVKGSAYGLSFGKVLSAGSKILIKSNYYCTNSITPSMVYCGIQGKVNVYGNVMSLGYMDDFINKELSIDNQFQYLFGWCPIISAKNLILPINTTMYCYTDMFSYCEELVEAPTLVADYLYSYCYYNMFAGCSKLKTIKILATQYESRMLIGETFSGWRDIAPNVTLYRKKEFSIMDDYVPSTWTIIDI